MTIDELFQRHEAIALDSSVLIYLLDGVGTLADAAQAVLDGLDEGRSTAAIASIALAEVLTGPAIAGDDERLERTAGDLWSVQGLTVVPLDRSVAVEAARARGEGRGLADAIHMASAQLSGATCLITNDRRVRSRPGVEVILLSDLTVPSGGPSPEGPIA